MKDRKQKLESVFLFGETKIGEHTIYPISANRMAFLRHIENEWFVKGDDERSEDEICLELMFVCSMKPDELTAYLSNIEQFEIDLLKFSVGLGDYDIIEFTKLFKREQEALEAGQVIPLGKDEAP